MNIVDGLCWAKFVSFIDTARCASGYLFSLFLCYFN